MDEDFPKVEMEQGAPGNLPALKGTGKSGWIIISPSRTATREPHSVLLLMP